MPAKDQLMVSYHDPLWVALSVLTSIAAAYAARNVSARIRDSKGREWLAWLVGGATADGIATWSMHFTAMVAYHLPLPVYYHGPTVLLSLLVGIVGSGAALWVVSRHSVGWARVLFGSVFLGGVGISCMHYTAMAAMRLKGMHRYAPSLVILSVVLAIGMSLLSLALTFLPWQDKPPRGLRKHASALLRGLANPVMHFTAMAAVSFMYVDEAPDLSHTVTITYLGTVGVGVVAVMGIVVALLTSLVDRLQKQQGLSQNLSRRLLQIQEEERRHLARELHDQLAQVLATVTLHLHAVKGLAGEAARPRLEECISLLQEAGEQMRNLALELRPSVLDSLGLEATLRWLGEQHKQRTGCEIQLVGHVSESSVGPELKIACFRVAQEALTNVARHAAATHVWIELSERENMLELVIRDDGVGFDVLSRQQQAAQHGGLGLLGMEERIQILGGTLDVESAPGRGTRIRASFPLNARSQRPPVGPAE
jgi:signal transduction histidine kinase